MDTSFERPPAEKQNFPSGKLVDSFLNFYSNIFKLPGRPSAEEFGLYERSDLESFIAGLPKQEADYWRHLVKIIGRSHDVNYWAVQPGSNMENFNRSIAAFQEISNSGFFSYPAVKKAQDIYENTLRKIRSEKGGFIPQSYVEYKKDGSFSDWDIAVKGVFLRSGIDWQSKTTGSEADLYLTLGKAAGNASLKFAEIMNEKPGLIGRFISAIKNRLTYPLKPLEQAVKIPVG